MELLMSIITLEPSIDYPFRHQCHDILLRHWQQFTSALVDFDCVVEYFEDVFLHSHLQEELSELVLLSVEENLPSVQ